MIAARPTSSESTSVPPQRFQQNRESGELLQNLFAGLSFPEVPTHTPTTLVNKKPEVTSLDVEVIAADTSTVVVEECPVEEKAKEQVMVHTAQTLASLYSFGETTSTSSSSYPDLPETIITTHHSTALRFENPETQHLINRDTDTLQQPTVSSDIDGSCPDVAEGCLVTDLVNENARLVSEVEDLKRSLLQSAPSAHVVPVPVPTTRDAPSSSSAMVRDGGAEERQGLLLQTAEQTAPQIKYICCGVCRTWQSAPFEAAYVKCPSCEAVNKCPATQVSNS